MTNNTNCPICKSDATSNSSLGDTEKINCKRCGEFSITRKASTNWRSSNIDSRQVANASGWIREHQDIKLQSGDIENLLSIKAPSVAERATKILVEISKLSTDLSCQFNLDSKNSEFWLGVSYSENPQELKYLFETYLKNELNFVSLTPSKFLESTFELDNISLTPKGYAYLDSLSKTSIDSQIGFCAMWFDESVKSIWTDAIEPAIKDAGYDAIKIDNHQHNNRIDDEIIVMLRRSKFVVADFTGQRGGVYFEAGFALGLGLQVIWTCEKSELEDKKIHFDTRQYNFITWEKDKLVEFKIALQNRIEATIRRSNIKT